MAQTSKEQCNRLPQFTNKCFGSTREAKEWIRSKPGYKNAAFKIAMNRRNYVRYAPPGAQLVCIKVYFEAARCFQRCWFAVSV